MDIVKAAARFSISADDRQPHSAKSARIVGVNRRDRDQLTALVDRATDLEQLASKIQLDEQDEALALQNQLEREYLAWYTAATTCLPDDLKAAFAAEYEGGAFKSRIRHFIQAPRQDNILWTSGTEETRAIVNRWQYAFNDAFRGPLLAQKKILLMAAARYGASGDLVNALELLEGTFRRLPFSIATLCRTVRNRPGLTMNDEYDLQRVVHAVLQLHFNDVRPEEYGPSVAGGSPRIDFVLPEVRVAIEVKMTRQDHTAKKLGNELAEDILRYRAHPDVGALCAVAYDPSRQVTNPTGFERDIFSDEGELLIRAVIIS